MWYIKYVNGAHFYDKVLGKVAQAEEDCTQKHRLISQKHFSANVGDRIFSPVSQFFYVHKWEQKSQWHLSLSFPPAALAARQ
jgi:hypothetical protein